MQELWQILGVSLLLLAGGVILFSAVWGRGLVALRRTNKERLNVLRRRLDHTNDPGDEIALKKILDRCEMLEAKWFLDPEDLELPAGSRRMLTDIAAAYHPKSTKPLFEARLGNFLSGCQEIQASIETVLAIPGFQAFTRFRLKHIDTLAEIFQKKKSWEASKLGQRARRWHVFFLVKWGYALSRCYDALFWTAKSGGYFLYDVVLKLLLVRWYLVVGETAVRVYRDRRPKEDVPPDDLLEDLDELGEPPLEPALPEGLQSDVAASRKELLFHAPGLSIEQMKDNYVRLIETIARWHHPESNDPVKEATLYDLMKGIGRMCDVVAGFRDTPVINKTLDVRIRHLVKVKETTEWILNSDFADFLKKYQVGTAVKYGNLIYKAFVKRQPAVLFKDFAFVLVRETGKRWLALTLHSRLAKETHRIYQKDTAVPVPPPQIPATLPE